MRINPFGGFVIVAVVLALPTAANAQCTPGGPPNPPARRGALVGLVMDSSHNVIEGAEVLVTKPARKTRTNVDGRFVLDNLDPGTYTLSVRRIGHEMAVQDYMVPDSGGVARFCLVPDATRLQPMVTSVKRLGLTGVIGDSTYQPLPGAQVRVVAQRDVVTDTAGGFFVPLKPGNYAVVVSKPGYGRQLLSVTIPKDSGRNIAVWLGSPPRNPNRMAAAYDEMRMRLDTANANRSALLPAEALGRVSVDLRFAAQAAIKAKLPTDRCDVIVDGGPYQLPIDIVDKSDVATMEIYMGRAPRPGPTSINPAGTDGPTMRLREPACGSFFIYVWMK